MMWPLLSRGLSEVECLSILRIPGSAQSTNLAMVGAKLLGLSPQPVDEF
jgi:hypothetical protein